MKTRVPILILIFTLSTIMCKVNAQSLQVSPELKELIGLSVNKDRRVAERDIDKQISEVQRKSSQFSIYPKTGIRW